jgi:hypothetical protein
LRHVWIVPRGLLPIFNHVPVCLQRRLCGSFLLERGTQTSEVKQFVEIVSVRIVHKLSVRDVVLLELSGDARFQSALYRVAGKVLGSFIGASMQE